MIQELILKGVVRVQTALHRIRNRQEGTSVLEWAMILGILGIAVIFLMKTYVPKFTTKVQGWFDSFVNF